METFLTRLVSRTLGFATGVKPLVDPLFVAGSALVGNDSGADWSAERVASPGVKETNTQWPLALPSEAISTVGLQSPMSLLLPPAPIPPPPIASFQPDSSLKAEHSQNFQGLSEDSISPLSAPQFPVDTSAQRVNPLTLSNLPQPAHVQRSPIEAEASSSTVVLQPQNESPSSLTVDKASEALSTSPSVPSSPQSDDVPTAPELTAKRVSQARNETLSSTPSVTEVPSSALASSLNPPESSVDLPMSILGLRQRQGLDAIQSLLEPDPAAGNDLSVGTPPFFSTTDSQSLGQTPIGSEIFPVDHDVARETSVQRFPLTTSLPPTTASQSLQSGARKSAPVDSSSTASSQTEAVEPVPAGAGESAPVTAQKPPLGLIEPNTAHLSEMSRQNLPDVAIDSANSTLWPRQHEETSAIQPHLEAESGQEIAPNNVPTSNLAFDNPSSSEQVSASHPSHQPWQANPVRAELLNDAIEVVWEGPPNQPSPPSTTSQTSAPTSFPLGSSGSVPPPAPSESPLVDESGTASVPENISPVLPLATLAGELAEQQPSLPSIEADVTFGSESMGLLQRREQTGATESLPTASMPTASSGSSTPTASTTPQGKTTASRQKVSDAPITPVEATGRPQRQQDTTAPQPRLEADSGGTLVPSSDLAFGTVSNHGSPSSSDASLTQQSFPPSETTKTSLPASSISLASLSPDEPSYSSDPAQFSVDSESPYLSTTADSLQSQISPASFPPSIPSTQSIDHDLASLPASNHHPRTQRPAPDSISQRFLKRLSQQMSLATGNSTVLAEPSVPSLFETHTHSRSAPQGEPATGGAALSAVGGSFKFERGLPMVEPRMSNADRWQDASLIPRQTQGSPGHSTPPSSPTVEVKIGQIEVRASAPSPAAPSAAPSPSARSKLTEPALSLGDYLNQRNGGVL